MREYVITTDAFADMPNGYYTEHHIALLNAMYTIAGKEYETNTSGCLDCKTFYDLVRKGEMPKTAQVNVDRAKACFTPIAASGKDIFHLAFSSALSGSCQACAIAAEDVMEQYPDCKIVVVDSLSASMGQGLLLEYCRRVKESGAPLEVLQQMITSERQRFCHFFTVDDLGHLHRGGRVSKLSAIVGGVLGIKPVLHVDAAGKLVPFDKVRGRKQSLLALADWMGKKYDKSANMPVYISHGDAPEDAAFLADTIRERYGVEEIVIGEVGPVIGAHSGPGTIALFFVGADRSVS